MMHLVRSKLSAAALLTGMALAIGGSVTPTHAQPADAIYVNGVIYTVEEDQPWATSMAVRDGILSYVGDDAGAEAWMDESTMVVDLNGSFVMPGIYDSHLHPDLALVPELMGQFYFEQEVPTPDDIKQAILEFADANPGDGWIVGRGWDPVAFQSAGEVAGRAWLDAFMPD